MKLVVEWRHRKSAAYDLEKNSTARRVVQFDIWGQPVRVYANANLSIYSAQSCNARCRFCVEELRPASRGAELAAQRTIEKDDTVYFGKLRHVLEVLRPLHPSVSITGGEPSLDPRLPAILQITEQYNARKRTITTNGSGLLQVRDGKKVIDWICETRIRHLNISRAHADASINARLMGLRDGLSYDELGSVIRRTRGTQTRPRLSCVLVRGAVESLADILDYLEFAASLGVDNVIFRQLMKTDPQTVARNHVVRFSDASRVALEPLLEQITHDRRFRLQRQIVGYYYYVEVWRYFGMDVVFEEADLAQLERAKQSDPGLIHELVYHPNGRLASTWQPWDGVLPEPNAGESKSL